MGLLLTILSYFLGIFCGSRGPGKSYLFTKLLKTLEEKKAYLNDKLVPQRILLISLTANSDRNLIFKTLKNLDRYNDVIDDYNDDLLIMKMDELKIIQKIINYIKKLGNILFFVEILMN